jgi:pimeloyl-ACP methyl ester carboxylesterase
MATDAIERVEVGGGIELAYETFGDPERPLVLLVMGLGTQMLAWQDDFCAGLAARDLFVVRFDNRDVGLSTHLHDAPTPDIGAVFAGDRSTVPYTLSDMAADTVGLIKALGRDRAHLVGASMGGMIAQTMAIEQPERVASLTSIMSTTGDRRVGDATPAAVQVLMAPPAQTRDAVIERALAGWRVIGSPGFPRDEDELRERAGRAFDRAHDPPGVGRQFAAILASGDRTAGLRALRTPTLVIHGREDPLVRLSGGEATASAIPGAELVVIDGMGHDLPRPVWPRIFEPIAALVERAEGSAAP